MKTLRLMAMLALAAGFAACGPQVQQFPNVPDELVGQWHTSNLRYADRYFELQRNSVLFATGEENAPRQPVLSVEYRREEGRALYTVFYTGQDGTRQSLSFFLDNDELRFKNQSDIIWKKHIVLSELTTP